MKRQLVQTKDQSATIFVPELDEHYHSVHGALAESEHVYISAGLKALPENLTEINLLEMGFGTGLNAWLTLRETRDSPKTIRYHAIEKYPLALAEAESLNYAQGSDQGDFMALHRLEWGAWHQLNEAFGILKENTDLRNFESSLQYNLIYFDAFAPSAQPSLWSRAIFEKLYDLMADDGVLVTYCVKGEVRRNMAAAGFAVEKIPGPPGKREMARAFKSAQPSK